MKIENVLAAAIAMLLSVGLLAQEGKPKEPERLAKARKIYVRGIAKIDEERDKKAKDFTARYIRELEKIQTAYTKKGDLDAALAVRKEIDGLKPLLDGNRKPAVTEAPEEDEPKLDETERNLGYKLGKSPKDAKKYRRHYYKVLTGVVNWKEAAAKCRAMGGYLACLETEAELKFIQKITEQRPTWVGGSDADIEGKFVWLNGKLLDTKELKNVIKFDNYRGKQHYLFLHIDKGKYVLDDHYLDGSGVVNTFVCEWED